MAFLELRFSIRKQFFKKETGGTAFALLACFIYKYQSLQADQVPQEHLSFLQNTLNFIIAIYLKQEVNNILTVCVDESSPCGCSVTGDINAMQSKDNDILPPMEKCPMVFYQGVVFTAQNWYQYSLFNSR